MRRGHQTMEMSLESREIGGDGGGKPLFPAADTLKLAMGAILSAAPQQPGESVNQAFERAYKQAYADAHAAIKPKLDAEAAERQRKADLQVSRAPWLSISIIGILQ
jgi:hypothetical protein